MAFSFSFVVWVFVIYLLFYSAGVGPFTEDKSPLLSYVLGFLDLGSGLPQLCLLAPFSLI